MREEHLYEQLARYLNLKHPHVIYHFDLSGVWTPSHKARNLYGRLNKRAWPDLFIANRKWQDIQAVSQGGYFLELKREGTQLYKKDGTLRANPHHAEQAAILQALREQGYAADFAVGFDEAVRLIDEYLS
jgi:hypothetical protein